MVQQLVQGIAVVLKKISDIVKAKFEMLHGQQIFGCVQMYTQFNEACFTDANNFAQVRCHSSSFA